MRVSGGIIARILCGVYRWLTTSRYFDAAVGHHASFLSLAKHTFRFEKRLLSFRPFRIHGMCARFFFVHFIRTAERKRECESLLVCACFNFIILLLGVCSFFRYGRRPSSSPSPALTLRLAFIFHPHIAWRRFIFASFAQVAAIENGIRLFIHAFFFFRCHGWCCCHFIIL